MEQNVHQLSFDDEVINPSKLRTTVRFSPEEYKIIKKDSNVFNKSLAQLLRSNYFERLPTTLLMTPENFKVFRRIYSGIANNCNQLTKRAHLGFAVPEKAVLDFTKSNDRLIELIRKLNGNS